MQVDPTQLRRIKAKAAELAADIQALEQCLAVDTPTSLNKIRFITEKVLTTLCEANGIERDDEPQTFDWMLAKLASRGVVPKNVAPFVRTIQTHTNAGSHFQALPLGDSHVLLAQQALVEFLDWYFEHGRAGSGAAAAPASRPGPRPGLWAAAAAGVLAVVLGGAFAWYAYLRAPAPAPLRAGLVKYGDNTEHVIRFFDRLAARLHAAEPQRFTGAATHIAYNQDDVGRAYADLRAGRIDVLRYTPYFLLVLKRWREADGVHAPFEPASCYTYGGADHHAAVLFARADAPLAAALCRDPRRGDAARNAAAGALLHQLAAERRAQFYRGNVYSMSSYVVPCLSWPELAAGTGSAVTAGTNRATVDKVLDPAAAELRVGAMSEFSLRYELAQTGREACILWRSDDLPQGGIAVVKSGDEERDRLLLGAVQDLAREGRGTPETLAFTKNMDFDGLGDCNGALYRDFESRVEAAAGGACGLLPDRPK